MDCFMDCLAHIVIYKVCSSGKESTHHQNLQVVEEMSKLSTKVQEDSASFGA